MAYGEGNDASIIGHFIEPHCLHFDQEKKEELKGKLVYIMDIVWLFADRYGGISTLPSGFMVDAATGDVIHTNFYCPAEEYPKLCK